MENNHYLQYVSQVLGVESVLLPESDELREKKWLQSFQTRTGYLPEDFYFDLVIVNQTSHSAESLFSDANDELYQKMKLAMKLHDARVIEVDTHLRSFEEICHRMNELIESPYLILFGHGPKKFELQTMGTFRVLETYSPAHLIQHPEKKKLVWDSLQKLMRELAP